MGGFSVKVSNLKAGRKYGWKAVREEGVDYDPSTDAAAVRAVMKSWTDGAAEKERKAGGAKTAGTAASVSSGVSLGDGTDSAKRELEDLAATVFNGGGGDVSGARDVLGSMNLRAVRSQFSRGRVTLTDFMLGMESLGVKAVPNLQSTGNVAGVSGSPSRPRI